MSPPLYLVFPQWQGSGAPRAERLYEGAWQLQAALSDRTFVGVPVNPEHKAETEDGVVAYSDLVQHLSDARDLLSETRPERIVSLGGDCGVDVAPASWLKKLYGDDLAVIWLDAHADLNTPASSPSGTFHGMALRALLGDLEPELSGFSALEPYGVFLAGVRDFDPPEYAYFEENRLSLFSVVDLERQSERLVELVKTRGFSKLHIHLDFDVLEPSEFAAVGYPVAGGLSVAGLATLLETLSASFDIVGLTLTEFMPQGEEEWRGLEPILKIAPLL